jgi:putative component of membrane protein insertase Oxa1/YidC/SpoIIIJ protein YidD
MTTKALRQLTCSLKMYTVHFLFAPAPWGKSGYDPVPEKNKKNDYQ